MRFCKKISDSNLDRRTGLLDADRERFLEIERCLEFDRLGETDLCDDAERECDLLTLS